MLCPKFFEVREAFVACCRVNCFNCTGYTQKNGAVSIVNAIETAPLFCVCPVHGRCLLADTGSPGFSHYYADHPQRSHLSLSLSIKCLSASCN